MRDGDHHLLIGDGIFHTELRRAVFDGRAAFVAKTFLDVLQLVLDDAHAQVHIVEHVVEVSDELHQFVVLVLKFLAFHACELAQTHFDDGLGLDFGEVPLSHQALLRFLHGLRCTDEGDDFVDNVKSFEETFEDVGALLCLLEVILGAADHHFVTVFHVLHNHILEVQRHRTTVNKGDVIDTEGGLQGGHLIELVEHHFGHDIFLEFIDNTGAVAFVGEILHVGDAGDLALLDEIHGVADHVGRVGHVR